MDIQPTALPGVLMIRAVKIADGRGFFSETFKQAAFAEAGVHDAWVQDNHAFSSARGVVRGLHFQAPPRAQAKLVRVTRGAAFDVVVDLRRSSAHYGKHASFELSAEAWTQLYIPVGFAHGICTLTAETDVLYKVSAPYAPALARTIRWNDPALAIDWPVASDATILSDADKAAPGFAAFQSPFD